MKAVLPKKWSNVYSNPDFIWVETRSGYSGGLPDPAGPNFFLTHATSPEELGASLRACVEASRFLHPKDDPHFFDAVGRVVPEYEAWVAQMLQRCGYKTKRVMFKDMKNVSIELAQSKIHLRPMRHAKLEAWERDRGDGIEDVFVAANVSNGELGEALRLALSRAIA